MAINKVWEGKQNDEMQRYRKNERRYGYHGMHTKMVELKIKDIEWHSFKFGGRRWKAYIGKLRVKKHVKIQ